MKSVCSRSRLVSMSAVIWSGLQSTPRRGPSTVIPVFEARKNSLRRLADQPLVLAGAVDPRGVEVIVAEVERAVQQPLGIVARRRFGVSPR
jgi:hypothetical protein